MLIFLLGGARSGKSEVAESLARRLPQPVTYIATLTPDTSDPDLGERIAAHQRRRPASWRTVDAVADLSQLLEETSGTVLLDSCGPWVAQHGPTDDAMRAVGAALKARPGDSVVVSDEVGMSVHPSTSAGREFRDRLGALNNKLAAAADRTLVVVAGRVLRTDRFDPDAVLNEGG